MLAEPKSRQLESQAGRGKAELGLEREVERACGQLHLILRIMSFCSTTRLYLEGYTPEAKAVSTRVGPRQR